VTEIAVLPFSEAADIVMPIEINEAGEATVTGEVSDDKWKVWAQEGGKKVIKGGKKLLKQNKKLFGRIQRKVQRRVEGTVMKMF
jgi:hypothetical protein